jgi:hypothetical protein
VISLQTSYTLSVLSTTKAKPSSTIPRVISRGAGIGEVRDQVAGLPGGLIHEYSQVE